MVFGFILAAIVGVAVADVILRILKRKKTSGWETARDSSSFVTKFMRRV